MIDVEKLHQVNEVQLSLTLRYNHQVNIYESIYYINKIKKKIKVYNLKNLEEVVGKLLLISIDPKDKTTGYALVELGDELFNIIIYTPKEVFREWDKTKGIFFHEKVGILRLDKEGIPWYHFRYINPEKNELNKEINEYLTSYINLLPDSGEPLKWDFKDIDELNKGLFLKKDTTRTTKPLKVYKVKK